ncbi:C40 family peptidase [Pontibacter sp. KCTC 32443]|uniref:C40 family peptidase n=1 Tax=Pontibacter TaxID=323449 RepID=UPI00164D2A28|nr:MULTISPECIES: NlpC/P60 family protein [Pontibacter]MBC5774313.1 C40 family peptidase [Pontibacter sp. KCTC 32443]
MRKTFILCILAAFSLILSYFYEVTPAESANLPEPVADITPYAINSGEDLTSALIAKDPLVKLPEPEPEPAPAPKPESEAFYSKKLRMQFATSKNKNLVETVAGWLGTPYRYGSGSKRGTDCSGFVTSIYREVYGIRLSRSSHSMYQDVKRIKKGNLRTGDLVFFKRGPKQPIFHVGIYLKNGKFIHSATNGGVMVSSLKEKFYSRTYYAGGRVN